MELQHLVAPSIQQTRKSRDEVQEVQQNKMRPSMSAFRLSRVALRKKRQPESWIVMPEFELCSDVF